MPVKLPASSALAAEQEEYPYGDSKCHPVLRQTVGSDELIATFLAATPAWADSLMRARDQIVGVFGLKTTGPRQGVPQAPFRVSQQLGVFRILHLAPGEAILGEDDRHLDFRVSLFCASGQLRVSTLVRPHNAVGWLYLAIVLPFHHLISSVMARRMVRIINNGATP
ncbi:DUF2867 domain-containing protein [Azoarcus sp. L1K30]|uniref:DUF2867 domain-containing protein n=1 Tax=Azoarcus sp. L1K30 TaxID=2820277 RepID=UPI001B81CCF2|nr:DUF2867 domain-containing protein [Azoarcus sp. L1K30]MBR0564628.1 DUF2867 domain-containing protein [Azoarcus sp. L1K30]